MLVRVHPNLNLADFLVGCACAAAVVQRGPWAGLHLSSDVLALLCVAVCSLDVVTFELATRHSCSTASFTQRHARVVASIVLQVQRTLEERGRQQLPTADCRGRRTRGSVQVVLSVRRARAHAFASLDKLQPSASLAARIEKDSVAPRKSPANCKASRRSTGEHGRAGRQPPARERRQQSWRGASGCTRLPGRAHWACCEC